MLQIIGDLHTHTVACGHALGTVNENLAQAKQLGHRCLAITEHCGAIPSAPHLWFFDNLLRTPREVDGVVLIRGVETNIRNRQGEVDLPEHYLRRMELVIASAHVEAFEDDRTDPDYTEMYCSLAANPLVDIIGHSGDPRFPHNCEETVRAYRKYGKVVEINGSSPRSRKGSQPICLQIAKLCKYYGVPVVLSSDAHCSQNVGAVASAAALLESIDFPESLIINSDYGRLKNFLFHRRGLELPD